MHKQIKANHLLFLLIAAIESQCYFSVQALYCVGDEVCGDYEDKTADVIRGGTTMHKLEKKVILIDVDGTLVDYENHLPPSAAKAIRMARAQGHLVYICTGRSRSEVYDEIWNIGLDGMIGANGGYIEHHGEVLFHAHLKKEQCSAIVDWLHSSNLEFYLESNTGLYASEHFEEAGEPVMQKYMQRKGKGQENNHIRTQFPDMVFGENLYREDVNKISFILNSYADVTAAAQYFPDLKISTWGGKGETALFGDIGIQDIDKATAISLLLKYLHMEQKDTIAFGDAAVDIPMLEYCALGIAMASGGKEIKAMADDITAAVNQDGLYKAFSKYNLL